MKAQTIETRRGAFRSKNFRDGDAVVARPL